MLSLDHGIYYTMQTQRLRFYGIGIKKPWCSFELSRRMIHTLQKEQTEEALPTGIKRCREKISEKPILANLCTRIYASVQEHEHKSHHYPYEKITINEQAFSLALQ